MLYLLKMALPKKTGTSLHHIGLTAVSQLLLFREQTLGRNLFGRAQTPQACSARSGLRGQKTGSMLGTSQPKPNMTSMTINS